MTQATTSAIESLEIAGRCLLSPIPACFEICQEREQLTPMQTENSPCGPHHKRVSPLCCPQHAGKLHFNPALTKGGRAHSPILSSFIKTRFFSALIAPNEAIALCSLPVIVPCQRTLSTSSQSLPSTRIRSECSGGGTVSALPVVPRWEGWGQTGSHSFPKLLMQAGVGGQEPTRLGRDPLPASPRG